LNTVKTIIKKTLKAILWVAIGFVLLFVIIAAIIQIPTIQNKIVGFATTFVSNKTHTRVEIKNIHISFPKSVIINNLFLEDIQKDTLLFAGEAKINMALFDLISSKISISSFGLENATINLYSTETDSLFNYNFLITAFSDTSTSAKINPKPASKWTFSINKVNLKNIRLRYDDAFGGMSVTVVLKDLDLKMDEIDIAKSIYSIDKLLVEQLNASVKITKLAIAETKKPESILPIITAKNIQINNSNVVYTNGINKPEKRNTFDVNRLQFSNLNLEATDLLYSADATQITINQFSTLDQNQFAITKFETEFNMDKHSITLKKLNAETTHSSIAADLNMQYSSLKSLKDSLPYLILNLELDNVSINNADVLYFNPQLIKQPFFKNITNSTHISGTVNGKVNNLKGENMLIKTGVGTLLETDFNIAGLPDAATAYFSFPNLKLHTTKHDILMMVGSAIPDSIELPENLEVKLAFNGTMKSFESTVELATSFGSAQLFASIDKNENFTSNVSISNFDLGGLLKDTTLFGTVTLTAAAKGHGLDKNTITAKIDAEVSEIYLKKYAYHNLSIDGTIRGPEFEGNVNLNDENAKVGFEGVVNINPNQEHFKFRLNVEGADLQKLNFTKDDIRIGLTVAADLKGVTLNTLNGTAGISNIIVAQGEKVYRLDSVLFASINEPNKSQLSITSSLVDIKYSGNISPAYLQAELSDFVGNYFQFSDSLKTEKISTPSNFTFEIQLHNHPMLSQVLLPKLKEFEPGIIRGSFNGETNDLKLDANIKKIVYSTTVINDLAVNINSDTAALNYKITSSNVSNAQVKLENLLIDGKLENNTLFANISSIADNQDKKLLIRSQITRNDSIYRLVLNNDFYLMNHRWNIAADNYIEFGKDGFLIHHLFMTSNESQINFASVHNKFNDDLNLEIKNFKLEDISRIIEKDTSLVRGRLNGNVLLKRVNESYGIIADATISKLIVRDVPIGDLSVKADNPTSGRFDLDVNLSGTDNKLTAKGYYIPAGGNNSIHIITDIQSLSMKTIEAFSMGQITEAAGTITGNISVKGASDNP